MKKLVAVLLTMGMLLGSSFMIPVSAADTAAPSDPFEGRDEVNIVYLGGSITAGAGASDKSKIWVNQVDDYFTKRYEGQKTINKYNVGVGGTGSDYGILRLKRDVIDKNPDLVFVEFAVNDGGKDSTRYMESIVRSLQGLEKAPYIIFLYTTQVSQDGQLRVDSSYHEKVAQYYGIRSIDLQAAMQRKIDAGENPLIYFGNGSTETPSDRTHPNESGYQVYADEILSKLPDASYYQRPAARESKLSALSDSVSATFTAAKQESVVKTGTWTEENGYLKSAEPGATLTFSFTGNILALEHRLHKNAGQYSISVDYAKPVTVDPYYRNNSGQLVVGYQNFNLGRGTHTVALTVLESKNEASDGSEGVSFYNFITDEDDSPSDRIYQDFEDQNLTDVNPAQAYYDWTDEETAGGSRGAVKVRTNKGGNNNTNSIRFRLNNLKTGQKYRLSVKLKLNNPATLLLDRMSFVIYFKKLDENGNPTSTDAYAQVIKTNAGLVTGDPSDPQHPWVTVEGEYTYTGKARQVSVGDVECTNFGTIEVRVGGDQQMEDTTGNADDYIEYYMDDLIVEPMTAVPPGETVDYDLLMEDDFNDGFVSGSPFSASGCTVTTEGITRELEGGGTSPALQIQETADFGALRRNDLTVSYNRAHKLSFWARATDTASVGKVITAYLDKKNKSDFFGTNYWQVSTKVQPTGDWLLTESWQKFEGIYYKNMISYADDKFDFYFRLGDGKSRLTYQMDDIRFEALDMPFNGSFAALTPGSWGNSVAFTYVDEVGAPGAETGYIRITNTTDNSELSQAVHIRPGKEYKISFWAKAEKVDAAKYPEGKLPITMIVNRFLEKNENPNAEYKGANFQYIPQNNVEPDHADYSKLWFMTSEWQKFETVYKVPNNMVAGYRYPKIQFRAGSASEPDPKPEQNRPRTERTYCLDEIKIEEIVTEDKMDSFTADGTLDPGETVTVQYTYNNASAVREYAYRIYTIGLDGVQATLKQGITTETGFEYVIPDAAAGKPLRIEVIPVMKTGEWMAVQGKDVGTVSKPFSVTPRFTSGWAGTVTAEVAYTNDPVQRDIRIVMAAYSADDHLENVRIVDETLTPRSEDTVLISIPTENADCVKLFVWKNDESIQPIVKNITLYKNGQEE